MVKRRISGNAVKLKQSFYGPCVASSTGSCSTVSLCRSTGLINLFVECVKWATVSVLHLLGKLNWEHVVGAKGHGADTFFYRFKAQSEYFFFALA